MKSIGSVNSYRNQTLLYINFFILSLKNRKTMVMDFLRMKSTVNLPKCTHPIDGQFFADKNLLPLANWTEYTVHNYIA